MASEVTVGLDRGLLPRGSLNHAVTGKQEEARRHDTAQRPSRRPVKACVLRSSGKGDQRRVHGGSEDRRNVGPELRSVDVTTQHSWQMEGPVVPRQRDLTLRSWHERRKLAGAWHRRLGNRCHGLACSEAGEPSGGRGDSPQYGKCTDHLGGSRRPAARRGGEPAQATSSSLTWRTVREQSFCPERRDGQLLASTIRTDPGTSPRQISGRAFHPVACSTQQLLSRSNTVQGRWLNDDV